MKTHRAFLVGALGLLLVACTSQPGSVTTALDATADATTDVGADTLVNDLGPDGTTDVPDTSDASADMNDVSDSAIDAADEGEATDAGDVQTDQGPTITVRGTFTVPEGVVIPSSSAGVIELTAVDYSANAIAVVATYDLPPLSPGAVINFEMQAPDTPAAEHLIPLGSYPDLIEADYLLIAHVDGIPLGISFPDFLYYFDGTLADYLADHGAVLGWNVGDPTVEGQGAEGYLPYDPTQGFPFGANLLYPDRPPLELTIAPDLSAEPNLAIAIQYAPFPDQVLPPELSVGGISTAVTGPDETINFEFSTPPADHGNLYKGRTIQRYEVIAFADTNTNLSLDDGETVLATSTHYAYYFGVVTWQAGFSVPDSTFSVGWTLFDLGAGSVPWQNGLTLVAP